MQERASRHDPEPLRDMSRDVFPRLPEPITDIRYGEGWRLPMNGQEVVLFLAPPREPVMPTESVIESEPLELSTETPSNTKTESERKDRVEVTGRVGKTPELKQTAKGVAITKFPLAEHPDGKEGETVWHTIVSFKELAKNVSETVKKGDQVKVIGYRSQREYNGKTTAEINAVVVKPPKVAESKVDD